MEVSPCRNPTAPSVSTTARITSNSVKISTTWSAVDTAPSPERSTGMPMRRSAPTFSRTHQRPQNQQLQSNRSILQGYPGTGVPTGIVIACRTFLLAFSCQPCYNSPRCRVRISAIIVASQASEAGSIPVPCSRKEPPLSFDKGGSFQRNKSLAGFVKCPSGVKYAFGVWNALRRVGIYFISLDASASNFTMTERSLFHIRRIFHFIFSNNYDKL